MSIKTLTRSFAGGEITPELFGRIDLGKFQTGLAVCRNFIVLPHGPVTRRPGTKYVREVKTSAKFTRLIPFAYSAEQTMVLEFGDQYIRFHTQGGTLLSGGVPYEIASPFLEADLHDLHFTQSADVLTITHPTYGIREVRRLGATNWTVSTVSFQPSLQEPSGAEATATGTGTILYQYAVTSVAANGVDESIASNTSVKSGAFTISAITIANPAVLTTTAAHGITVGNPVYISSVAGVPIDGFYTANTVPGTTTMTLKDSDGNVVSTLGSGPYTANSGRLSLVGVKNNLSTAGNYNTITWNRVATAARYNVYKMTGGVFAYIGQASENTFKDDNFLGDQTKVPPESFITLNDAADAYPSTATYHEQRRWFAGTNSKPQTVFATRTATETNLTSSIPSLADDALEVKLAAQQQNRIRHLVPLSDLIALTAGGEWRIFNQGAEAITPTSISLKPQGYSGASNVQPVVTSGSILYVQAQGSRVRELSYNWESNAYKSVDMSIMAPHLAAHYTLVDLAYSRAPDQVMWAVRSDGALLAMTYVPEHQVYAWSRHDSDGQFESICTVAEGTEDALYAVVKRTIGGATKRYVERLETRFFDALEDAYMVDCGATYDGVPNDTITGLTWLEGKTVNILADGAVHPQRVVTSGSITLDYEASKIHIGLPIVADIKTLPLAFEGAQAAGQGTLKNVNKVHLRVYQSSGVQAGPSFSKLTTYPTRSVDDPYGTPPALRTGELAMAIGPSWNTDGGVCVRQTEPLPLTILSMTLEVATGG